MMKTTILQDGYPLARSEQSSLFLTVIFKQTFKCNEFMITAVKQIIF